MRSIHKSIHRAWFVLGGLCLAHFICAGFSTNVAGLYLTTISSSVEGIRYGELSFSLTAQSIMTMLCIMAAPFVVERISVRKLLVFETILLAGCLFASSFFSKTWQWIANALLIGECQAFMGGFTLGLIIVNWFKKRYSFAVGLIFAASGVSGAILNPFVSFLIETFGWRNAYRIEAVIVLLVLLPIFLFVVRFKPAELNMLAYGEEQGDMSAIVETVADPYAVPDAVLLHTYYKNPTFLLFCLATAVGTLLSSIPQHVISMTISIGLEYNLGVKTVTFFMIVTAIFNIMGGWLIDRFGYLRVCLIYFTCSAIGMTILIASRNINTMRFFAAVGLCAIGNSLLYTAMPAWIRAEFPKKVFGKLYAVLEVTSWAVYAVAVSGYGLVYDHFGNFIPVFCIVAGAAVVTDGFLLLAYRRARQNTASMEKIA